LNLQRDPREIRKVNAVSMHVQTARTSLEHSASDRDSDTGA
jgi:hypothetical protein